MERAQIVHGTTCFSIVLTQVSPRYMGVYCSLQRHVVLNSVSGGAGTDSGLCLWSYIVFMRVLIQMVVNKKRIRGAG